MDFMGGVNMARKRKDAYKENPFIKEYVETTGFRKIITSATDAGGNMVTTVLGKDPTMIKHVGLFNITTKIVDPTPFLKIKANALNPYNNLSPSGLKVFGFLMEECAGLEGRDKLDVVLSWDFLSEEQQKTISKTSFNRGINDLIEAKFIASSVVNNVFFVNPSMIYNGDSVVVATKYIQKGSKTEVQYKQELRRKAQQSLPGFEELPSGRVVNTEDGEIQDAEFSEKEEQTFTPEEEAIAKVFEEDINRGAE